MKEYKDINSYNISDEIIYDFKEYSKSIKVIIIENANNPKLKKFIKKIEI